MQTTCRNNILWQRLIIEPATSHCASWTLAIFAILAMWFQCVFFVLVCSCLFFCVSVVRSAAKPRCWSADWTRVAMWNYWVWSKNAVLLPWRSWVARYETGNRFWVFIPLSNCIYLLRSAEHPLGSWSDAACARCCSTVHDMPTLSKVDPPVQEALDLTAFRRCSAENSGS